MQPESGTDASQPAAHPERFTDFSATVFSGALDGCPICRAWAMHLTKWIIWLDDDPERSLRKREMVALGKALVIAKDGTSKQKEYIRRVLGGYSLEKGLPEPFRELASEIGLFSVPNGEDRKQERGRKRLPYFRRNDALAQKVYQCRKDEGFIRLPESWHSILDLGPVQAVNRSLAKDTAIATWVTLKRTKDAHFLFGNGIGLSEDRIEEIYRSNRLFLLAEDLSDTLFSCLDNPDTEILSGVKRG